jgi:hypothetical protein
MNIFIHTQWHEGTQIEPARRVHDIPTASLASRPAMDGYNRYFDYNVSPDFYLTLTKALLTQHGFSAAK